jgi:hypothetical protein
MCPQRSVLTLHHFKGQKNNSASTTCAKGTHARTRKQYTAEEEALSGASRLVTIRRTGSVVMVATLAGLDSVVVTETRLQAGRSVVRIPVHLEVLLNVQTSTGIHSVSYSMGTGVVPRGKGAAA